MFTLQFGTTNKAKNSTKVPAVSGSTVEVLLKESTSIIKPVFKINTGQNGMASASELFGYNYCYCAEFRRYYYITDIVSETAVVFYIHCEVDVLATFRDDILNTRAFVMYSQSTYNMLLNDSRLAKGVTFEDTSVTTKINKFDTIGSFIITLASDQATGETGLAQSYALDSTQMSIIAAKLFSREFFDEVSKFLGNPLSAVIACKWTPIKLTEASGVPTGLNIGGVAFPSSATAKKQVVGDFSITPYLKYKTVDGFSERAGDYRNSEPWSNYSLWLPGAGLTDISFNKFGGDALNPSLNITYIASPCTGDVTYLIAKAPEEGVSGTFLTVRGNFGVDIPLAAGGADFKGTISSGGTAIGGAATSILGAFTGNAFVAGAGILTAAGGSIGAMIDTASTTTQVSGSLGGFTNNDDMLQSACCITRNYHISDTPENCRDTIGLPLYATRRLGSLSGYVKCEGAYVKTWATQEEHYMIAQYVNSSSSGQFGGVIIE